jgi:hypothetical protein
MRLVTIVRSCKCIIPAIQAICDCARFACQLSHGFFVSYLLFAIGSVRLNPLTMKATDNSIEKEIKERLKFASERDGGKKCGILKSKEIELKWQLHPDVSCSRYQNSTIVTLSDINTASSLSRFSKVLS